MKVENREIKTVFINGAEQFTITIHENGEVSQKKLS
jgi:hypothetical protein